MSLDISQLCSAIRRIAYILHGLKNPRKQKWRKKKQEFRCNAPFPNIFIVNAQLIFIVIRKLD